VLDIEAEYAAEVVRLYPRRAGSQAGGQASRRPPSCSCRVELIVL
jgi:hypothetical protein